MLNVNRFSMIALKVSAVTMLTLIMLSGCTTASMKNEEYHLEGTKQNTASQPTVVQPTTLNANGSFAQQTAKNYDKKSNPNVDTMMTASTKSPVPNSVRSYGVDPDNFPSVQQTDDSAACRYIKNTADAEAVITASPTLSASSDEDGSGSVSIGMNILDINKSNLLRASGDAKCRMHEAAKKIEATLGLGTEITAYASSKAKEAYIRKNSNRLNALKIRANHLMNQGDLSRQDANLIKSQIAELYSDMEISRAQAERREGLPNLNHAQIKDGHEALVQATTDLHNINREMRTNEAYELSLSGGYRYSDQFNNDLEQRDNPGAFARLNVSVRLGALSPQRDQYEEAAAAAKYDSLYEQYTGVIWKSGYAKKAINRSLVHLKRSEKQLLFAYSQSNDTINNLKNSDRSELMRTLILTQIKNIQLGSELASTRASIKELQTYQSKIGAL